MDARGENGVGAADDWKSGAAESVSFEETFGLLQATIARLEEGGLPLEAAIDAFERGIQLADRCTAILDAAELRITRVLETREVDLDEPAF